MTKIKLLLGFGLLWGGTISLHAQNKMHVNLRSHTSLLHVLKEVKCLTFPVGQVAVNKTDGSSSSQVLGAIQNIQFELNGPVTLTDDVERNSTQMKLYPNPLKGDQLMVMLPKYAVGSMAIHFSKLNGLIEKQFVVPVSLGLAETALDLEGLGAGIYVCHVHVGNQVYTQKLIKY